MGNPWMKFYPADWRSDAGLGMCTPAARGIWMEMLCIMHEADGYLIVNGRAPTIEQLATLCRVRLSEMKKAIKELENCEIFSKNSQNFIYSRRIVKDIAKSEQDRLNGSKGGNPKIKKNGDGVNPPDNPTDKAKTLRSLEARKEREADASLVDDGRPVVDLLGPVDNVVSIDRKPRPAPRAETVLACGVWWNDLADSLGLPRIEQIKPGSGREANAYARARELVNDHGALDKGLALLAGKIRASGFLTGRAGTFRATFDWVMNSSNQQKILEGNYEATAKKDRR